MSFTLLFISILSLPKAVTAASFSLSDRPMLKYGTAWKKEATADLVYRALLNGFRHIDTACQPRHYNEAGVGEGWTKAVKTLDLKREDIWLQTKFSSLDAQDPDNTPYDRNAPLEDRVHVSFLKSSTMHLSLLNAMFLLVYFSLAISPGQSSESPN